MSPIPGSLNRPVVGGKFFRAGARKFHVKGITYGPFAPNAQNEMFASPEQTARDFQQIQELGANLLRVYYAPPIWLLDLAARYQLRVLIDIPWAKHLCFLDSQRSRDEARQTVRRAVSASRAHPAVFGYSVVNEISAEIVRWSGVAAVERFIESLVDEAKAIDPECLCTFTSFPPTEFLQPKNIDFVCFNIYLHNRPSFEDYLARLQSLADAKPLILGEFGMDSIRESEAHKCEVLGWQIGSAFCAGLAGTVIFSYTDDWFRGGLQIEDWAFGLTTRERSPKDSFRTVQKQYQIAPHFPPPRKVKVSVVVASYNGHRTLKACLESLGRLNYPDYEVILVDDGSTSQASAEIAAQFPSVRYIRQDNQGLSAARNTGIAAATGEVVAFTDDDCRVDEDWLHYMVSDLLRSSFVAIGGHNFLPPEDSPVAAAVAVSPGGPAHVMLTDTEAEHIPGCNMVFYKWVLDEIRGFDPVFRKAGDDVDVCWRIQDRGYKIGFTPAGFVWHYRRSTVKAYLKQQAGYGEAEALLSQKHPEYFNSFGAGIWRGRIYSTGKAGVIVRRAMIYHGTFGSGFFQRLYASDPALPLMLCTSLAYHTFVSVPLMLLSLYWDFVIPLATAAVVIPIGVCVVAAAKAQLPRHKKRLWSRPLIASLFFLQPIIRGWARFKWRLNLRSGQPAPLIAGKFDPAFALPGKISYWSTGQVDRYGFLSLILGKLAQRGWPAKADSGWQCHDAEIVANGWSRLLLSTATEELEQGRRNFCCRLESAWSLRAKVLFWLACGIEAILVALFGAQFPLLWLLPVTLALLHWFLEEEKQSAAQATVAVLDEAATEQSLVKLPGS